MIEKMEKIYVYGLTGQSTDIMEDIMRCGVVETTAAESMMEEELAGTLLPSEGVDLSREEALLEKLEESILALKEFGKKKSLFDKRPLVTYGQLTDDKLLLDTMETCSKIEDVVKVRNDYQKELKKIEFQRTSWTPWESLDANIEEFKTKHSRLLCYILPNPRTVEEIEAAAIEKEVNIYLKEISEDHENKYLIALFYDKDEQAVRETVGIFGAKEFALDKVTGTFKANIEQCDREIGELNQKLEAENEKLKKVADQRPYLEMAYDAIKVRMDCLSSKDKLVHTDKVDIITGWVLADKKELIDQTLEKYTCYHEYKLPEKDEEYPVSMKNSKLVEPFGAITEMYSLPNSGSMDSNWAIGFFFFLFFGMMLSDAGYGLILTIGGLVGAKVLDMAEGGKRLLKMLGLCGISTIFWGLIYGSFFGDVIPTVAQVFFGKTVEITPLIDPLTEPMTVLGLSCAFGVIHLFLGMGFKAYLLIKRGHPFSALFDVGFWYIFLIGLPLLLLPGKLKMIGIVMSIGGAIGLVLTQGREKPTVFGKITSGVMSLYDVTGYFSDVLSYSRVLALGLATGVIASVVNTIGTLSGGSIVGAILFVVIFVAGHALNMAINALGAYVHAARLQYVEFFGKYYESGGKRFDPLRAKTKYVNITEEK